MVSTVIKVNNLRKYFKVLNRREGFWGAVKDLFSNNYFYVKAVDGISMEIKEGEIVGFLGPNGAGKTTTIKILSTLLLPTSGEVKILGYDVIKEPEKVRKSINFVMGGERNLYARLSAIENLEYFADLYGVPYKNRKERIRELLEIVGLPSDRLKDKVETYSKGMKQRLQIARGLINDPEIIFLDEPTIGLDPIGARDIRNVVKKLKNMGKTIIFTSHYMQEVEELCDRVALLKSGEIITIDTPASLKSKYSESFEIKLLIDKYSKTIIKELEKSKYVKDLKIYEKWRLLRDYYNY
ncbi:MAG: ABC transporter [Dictyoglomus sp. NZ13-RE01]|nr:MAG: ABC transporter [Dictyoglomus sp. NZ13-RE01]